MYLFLFLFIISFCLFLFFVLYVCVCVCLNFTFEYLSIKFNSNWNLLCIYQNSFIRVRGMWIWRQHFCLWGQKENKCIYFSIEYVLLIFIVKGSHFSLFAAVVDLVWKLCRDLLKIVSCMNFFSSRFNDCTFNFLLSFHLFFFCL